MFRKMSFSGKTFSIRTFSRIIFRISGEFQYNSITIQYNDIQHNDIQHNNIQHNNIQHNNIQHKDIQHKGIQHDGILR